MSYSDMIDNQHPPDRAHLRAARCAVVENYDEEGMKQRLLALYDGLAASA